MADDNWTIDSLIATKIFGFDYINLIFFFFVFIDGNTRRLKNLINWSVKKDFLEE